MRQALLIAVFLSAIFYPAHGQQLSPSRLLEMEQLKGWKKWELQRTAEPPLTIYGAVDEAVRKPVLVILQGSKCVPLFRVESGRLKSPLLVTDPAFFSERAVHAVAPPSSRARAAILPRRKTRSRASSSSRRAHRASSAAIP